MPLPPPAGSAVVGDGKCDQCGATCQETSGDRVSRVTAWAVKHTHANPGHRVVVQIVRTHIYQRPERPPT